MIFRLRKSDAKQLVLSLCSFDLRAHLFRVYSQVLALVLQVLNIIVVLLFDVHEAFELALVPFQLLF